MANSTWLEDYLLLAFTPHLGPISFLNILKKFKNPTLALNAPRTELIPCLERPKQAWEALQHQTALPLVKKALQWQEEENCYIMTLADKNYPISLLNIPSPPPVLFLRGKHHLLHSPIIAIVGSRHATPQALRITTTFAQTLSSYGYCIVSGFATGVDSAAHQGALQREGSTIAILGTGIDRIYPSQNKKLAYQIAEQGLLISEFPLGTPPQAANFPRRNRIIAALGLATLVTEANIQSGSLITAKLAAEFGKEVMAIPGSILNPLSQGCHHIIQQGAKLITCTDDILEEITTPHLPLQKTDIIFTSKTLDATLLKSDDNRTFLDKKEYMLLEKMGYDPIHPDEIATKMNDTIDVILMLLMNLELAGMIVLTTNGKYQRIKF